jgi:hypothetical protein
MLNNLGELQRATGLVTLYGSTSLYVRGPSDVLRYHGQNMMMFMSMDLIY